MLKRQLAQQVPLSAAHSTRWNAVCPCGFHGYRNMWSFAVGQDVPINRRSDEVKTLRAEARQLKEALAEVTLENRLLKKSVIADGEDIA